MGRIRVKICGMTRLADAQCAVEAGVDALGFIFMAKSPRFIAPARAREIIAGLPPFVAAVGVFVNAELGQPGAIIQECGLNYAQLHGEETPEYCRQLRAAAPACRLIKALRIGGPREGSLDPAVYADCTSALLLDTYAPKLHGGTGDAFDWALIPSLQLSQPFLLAGGLHPGNVEAALGAVPGVYGLDANSGLEDAPGIKNHALICRFLEQVRTKEQALFQSKSKNAIKKARKM